jgi:hypothetical protein
MTNEEIEYVVLCVQISYKREGNGYLSLSDCEVFDDAVSTKDRTVRLWADLFTHLTIFLGSEVTVVSGTAQSE